MPNTHTPFHAQSTFQSLPNNSTNFACTNILSPILRIFDEILTHGMRVDLSSDDAY
jgi:hypothetical protein